MGVSWLEGDRTRSVIGAFYEVYNTLGFGFLERPYEVALERELLLRGHQVARELPIRAKYMGRELGLQRVDMVVDDKLIVAVVDELPSPAVGRIYNYLKATRLEEVCFCTSVPNPPSTA
jgi:GxxExxY protein